MPDTRTIAINIAVRNAKEALNELKSFGDLGAAEIDKLGVATTRASRGVEGLTRTVEAGDRSARQARQSFSNVGFQIQDIAEQANQGVNPLRIFIQQGGQLVSAFGPAGVALGVFITVVGAAAAALFGLTDSSDKAAKATKSLEDLVNDSSLSFDKLADKVLGADDAMRKFIASRASATAKISAEAADKDIKALADSLVGSTIRDLSSPYAVNPEDVAEIARRGAQISKLSQAGGDASDKLVIAVKSGRGRNAVIDAATALGMDVSSEANAKTLQDLFDKADKYAQAKAIEETAQPTFPTGTVDPTGYPITASATYLATKALDQGKVIEQEQKETNRKLAEAATREWNQYWSVVEDDARQAEQDNSKRIEERYQLTMKTAGLMLDAEVAVAQSKAKDETADLAAIAHQIRINELIKQGSDLKDEESQAYLAAGDAIDAEKIKTEQLNKAKREQLEQAHTYDEAQRQLQRQADQQAAILYEPFKNASNQIQNNFTQMFQNIYEGGVTSFGDLANQALHILTGLAAQLTTLAIFNPSLFAGGAAGAPGATGAAALPLGVGGVFGGATLGGAFPSVFGGGGPAGDVIGPQQPGMFPALAGVSMGGLLASGALGFGGGALISKLTGGNATYGGIGGALGGIGGFAFGGPFGAIGGAAAGGLLGGLLGGGGGKPTRNDNFNQLFDPLTGLATGSNFKPSAQNQGIVQGIVSDLQTLRGGLASLGATVGGAALALQAGNRSGYTLGGRGYGSPEALNQAALQALLTSAQGLGGSVAIAARSTKGRTAQDILGDLQFAQNFDKLTGSVTQFESSLEDLLGQFTTASLKAKELGLDEAKLAQARTKAIQDLTQQSANAVLSVADQLKSAYASETDPLRGVLNQLDFGPAATTSPSQQLGLAQSKYAELLAKVRGGDESAFSGLSSAAEMLIGQARDYGASGSSFQNIAEQVRSDLSGIVKTKDDQLAAVLARLPASILDLKQSAIEVLTKGFNDMVTSFEAMQRAILKQGQVA